MVHHDYDNDNNNDNDKSAITQLSTAHLKFCTELSFPFYTHKGTTPSLLTPIAVRH